MLRLTNGNCNSDISGPSFYIRFRHYADTPICGAPPCMAINSAASALLVLCAEIATVTL